MNLPHQGEIRRGKVMRRKRTHDGQLIGTSNANPILDTRLYEVEFDDGDHQEFMANNISQHLFDQIDDDGNITLLLEGIIDHRYDAPAVSRELGWVYMENNVRRRVVTTQGWDLKG